MHACCNNCVLHTDFTYLFLVRDTEDDDIAFQRNADELKKELKREKPKKEIVMSLSRQTYNHCISSVLSSDEVVCASSLIADYPEFKKPYVVS